MMSIASKNFRHINGLVLDATITEDYHNEVVITENPVEFGASINDHRILKPQRYTATGRVSDHPLISTDDEDQWKEGMRETRSKSAYAVFEELQRYGDPFDVQAGLKLYRNMVITLLTSTKSAENEYAFDFTVTMQELVIVNTKTVQVAIPEPGPTAEQATKTEDRGEVQAEEVKGETLKSLAAQGLDFLKNLIK